MSNEKKYDGGPVSPVPYEENLNGQVVTYGSTGVSLRDYFAGKAMQGGQANADNIWHVSVDETANGITWADKAAKEAYILADAMLKARDK